MSAAEGVQQIRPGLWLWRAYSSQVKSDLFSTAVLCADGLNVIDPIPLTPTSLLDLRGPTTVARVLITNSNHLRAAVSFALETRVPIFCHEQISEQVTGVDCVSIDSTTPIASDINPLIIDGAAPGETAFHFHGDGGTIVVGDALLHLEPYGFALLPPKYCSDQDAMRRSLRKLLDWSFERLLFAHGRPIVSAARARLEALLQ